VINAFCQEDRCRRGRARGGEDGEREEAGGQTAGLHPGQGPGLREADEWSVGIID